MKKFLFLLLTIFVLSCSKQEDSSSTSFTLNDIEIGFEKNMLVFKSPEDFLKTIDFYYDSPKICEDFFLEKTYIKNAFKAYSEVLDYVENRDWDNEENVISYLQSNSDKVLFKDNQVLPLFSMDYKNMFCNLQGYIQIGDYVYKYDNKGRYSIPAKLFSKSPNLNNFKYEILDISAKFSKIQGRDDYVGGCIDGFDNERIVGKCKVDLGRFGSPICRDYIGEIIAEASNKFQRKRWGVWWRARADRLQINTHVYVTDDLDNILLDENDIRWSNNAYKIKWARTYTFCIDCRRLYDFNTFSFDFHGKKGDPAFNCSNSLYGGGLQNLCK